MARRTKEAAAETRTLLLDTAELVFSRNGVAHTTLQDIADAAGLTRGAIYWHFKNKFELLEAMITRLVTPFDEYRRELRQQWPAAPLQQMRLIAIDMLQNVGRDPHWRALFTIVFLKCEYTGDADLIRQHYVAIRNRCIAESVADLSASSIDLPLADHVQVDVFIYALFSYIDGLIYNWLIEPEFFDLPTHAETLIDQFLSSYQRKST